jgi:hypothetical protein
MVQAVSQPELVEGGFVNLAMLENVAKKLTNFKKYNRPASTRYYKRLPFDKLRINQLRLTDILEHPASLPLRFPLRLCVK